MPSPAHRRHGRTRRHIQARARTPTTITHGTAGLRVPRLSLRASRLEPGSGQHHEEVVARDVRGEIDPAGIGRNPLTPSRTRLSAWIVDLVVHHEQPIPLNTCGGRRINAKIARPPQKSGGSTVLSTSHATHSSRARFTSRPNSGLAAAA